MSNPKPTLAQLTYESDEVRCFYCKALLLITDDKAGHAVYSENCPSRLVTLNEHQMYRVRKAWRFKKRLDEAKAEVAAEVTA